MSVSYSVKELIDIAIGIERRGIAFYDVMVKSVQNAGARDAFQSLADKERGHIQVFQDMLHEADQYQYSQVGTKVGTKEDLDYLLGLVNSFVFTDDMITSEMVAKVETDIEALELGIGAEKDSILFYYEMKEIMPQRPQPLVSKIIAEEKSHLNQLSELKNELAASRY